jgi:hypothetical protein
MYKKRFKGVENEAIVSYPEDPQTPRRIAKLFLKVMSA